MYLAFDHLIKLILTYVFCKDVINRIPSRSIATVTTINKDKGLSHSLVMRLDY